MKICFTKLAGGGIYQPGEVLDVTPAIAQAYIQAGVAAPFVPDQAKARDEPPWDKRLRRVTVERK